MEKPGEKILLPFTIFENIIVRLPPKSLTRFMSVCKFWSSHFKNPTFISKHHSRSIKNHTHTHTSTYFLLLRLLLNPSTHKLLSLSHESSLNQISIPIPNKSHTSLSQYIVSNSCDGLVCLYSEFGCGSDVFLCNPTTCEIRLLPQSNLATTISDDDGMVLGVGMGHGSGFSTEDIKVVRVWVRGKNYLAEEYRLSSDSWRTIESSNPWFGEFESSCFALFFKGVYYFWGKLGDSSATIFELDLGGGHFRKMQLPKKIDVSNVNGRYLGVLNGYMSLVCPSFCDKNGNFGIWVKKEGGFGVVGYSWIKVRTIENSATCVPLVFWKGNELLVKIYDMVRSYNVDTRRDYKVNVEVEGEGFADICEAIFCEESLGSINQST